MRSHITVIESGNFAAMVVLIYYARARCMTSFTRLSRKQIYGTQYYPSWRSHSSARLKSPSAVRAYVSSMDKSAQGPPTVISAFFSAYAHPVTSDVFRRVLTPILNSSRSTNPVTRSSSAELFKAIIGKASDPSDAKFALDELLALPKSGKTSGAEHRVALYTMLGYLVPSNDVSPSVVQSVPPLISKETHEGATTALAASLIPHLVYCLSSDLTLPSDAVSSIAKGMNDAKPAIRRAFCSTVGDALWQLQDLSTEAALAFAKGISSALETNLKTVAASPTAAPAGPLEGYVAVALLLGPYNRSGKFGICSLIRT